MANSSNEVLSAASGVAGLRAILYEGTFFGERLQSRTVNGITLTESRYRNGAVIPAHEHSTAFFDLVTEGSVSEIVHRDKRDRSRSSLAFHPAHEVHSSGWHGSDARCFHIELALSFENRVREYASTFNSSAHFLFGRPNEIASRLYAEFHDFDDLSPLVTEALVLELFAESARLDRISSIVGPPKWLLRVVEMLKADFAKPLTLDQIARSEGIHPSHLTRIFRRVTGCTVGEYVRGLRVEFACRELKASEVSLAEIALAAGFSDQSHFSNTFKRLVGTSPGMFRRASRNRTSGSI